MEPVRDLGWRYWLATVFLLAAWLSGWTPAIWMAIALCIVQIVHFTVRTGSSISFLVQVRLAYLILLIAGLWSPLIWIHVLQFIGTSARVLFSYCFLARTMSLAPWNRSEPWSLDLVRRTFFSFPTGLSPCAGAGDPALRSLLA
ncbi:MAG: hypothetical protein AB7G48_03890 [Nitrospiraceae bacterium]